MKCDQLTCRYSVKGLVSEFTREILCESCLKNELCNFQELSEADIERLAPKEIGDPIFPMRRRWNTDKIKNWIENQRKNTPGLTQVAQD